MGSARALVSEYGGETKGTNKLKQEGSSRQCSLKESPTCAEASCWGGGRKVASSSCFSHRKGGNCRGAWVRLQDKGAIIRGGRESHQDQFGAEIINIRGQSAARVGAAGFVGSLRRIRGKSFHLVHVLKETRTGFKKYGTAKGEWRSAMSFTVF